MSISRYAPAVCLLAGLLAFTVGCDDGASEDAADAAVDASARDICNMRCIDDREAAEAAGCDCAPLCHDACSFEGVDCGLPCNIDVEGYACPYWEDEVAADDDCTYYESDSGAYEHFGRCYRCGNGQQCCYSEGRDNGSGSFDLCAPLDPGPPAAPDPDACRGVLPHCDCDVVPLCGCMAQSGALDLCGDCVGDALSDVSSCNAEGMDATFCQRAAEAAEGGFDWCGIMGSLDTCFDRPEGFGLPSRP